VITFSATLIILAFIAMAFLIYFNVYADYMTLFRKGFFQIVSGHTTTGFQTINVIQFTREWPYLSLFAVIVSMILGASACSTGGGIKALRVGIIIKMFIGEIKKIILPENTVIVQKYHHIRPAVISDQIAKGALFVAAGYVILFTLGSLITMFYGYSMIDSMFETASAVGNTGLSVGVSSPNLDPTVKITYIILMWAGRLEITAVFVLLGFTYIAIRRLSYISGEVYHTGEKAAENIIKPVKK
jgi:trk system potassium uptake protein TrkH